MVTHLVGDNVGIGKVAIGADLALHALKELQVEIHRFVRRTIEWSTCRGSISAARADSIAEDDHLRRVVGATHLGKLFGPHVFRAGEDALAESHQFHIDFTVVLFDHFGRIGLGHLFHDGAWITTHKANNQIDNNTTDADTTSSSHCFLPSAVFHIGTFSTSF